MSRNAPVSIFVIVFPLSRKTLSSLRPCNTSDGTVFKLFSKKNLRSVENISLTVQIEILQACQLSEGITFKTWYQVVAQIKRSYFFWNAIGNKIGNFFTLAVNKSQWFHLKTKSTSFKILGGILGFVSSFKLSISNLPNHCCASCSKYSHLDIRTTSQLDRPVWFYSSV